MTHDPTLNTHPREMQINAANIVWGDLDSQDAAAERGPDVPREDDPEIGVRYEALWTAWRTGTITQAELDRALDRLFS